MHIKKYTLLRSRVFSLFPDRNIKNICDIIFKKGYKNEQKRFHKKNFTNYSNMYRPYNVDLIDTLLIFNDRIGNSAYKDKSLKELLMFIFANTRNKYAMEKLKEAIWNPLIQSEEELKKIKELKESGKSLRNLRELDKKVELEKYRKSKFPNSYESLVFFKLAEIKDREKSMREEIENNDKLFNPYREKEIYYKTTNRHSRKKEKNIVKINEKEIYLMYTAGLGAFIYRHSNEEKFKKYSKISRDFAKLENKPAYFYFYQMY